MTPEIHDEGLYRITDLRLGTYDVRFTLPGFNAVRRQGLELVTGFTANVNADLQVGVISETVTVTGASPMVDVPGSWSNSQRRPDNEIRDGHVRRR